MDALSLHKNKLASLPPSLAGLVDLSRLSLYENLLEDVPQEICSMTALQEL